MQKVLIYARCSKDEQHPEKQINLLRGYAEKHAMIIEGAYQDIITGRSSTRPELTRMISRIREGGIDAVLIYKLDRLGRSVQHLIQLSQEFQKKGVDIICVTQPIDTTTPSGKMFFVILGAIAEFEADLISERTKMGLRKAKNVGKRGKDKKPRRKSGYYARYAKQRGLLEK